MSRRNLYISYTNPGFLESGMRAAFKSDFLRKSDLPDLAPSPNMVFYMSNRRFFRADLKSGLRNVIRGGVRAVRASEVGKMALFGPSDCGQFFNFSELTDGYPNAFHG